MDRTEYLVRLRRAVNDLPEDVQNDIIASFEKQYVRALTAGISQEAILEQFPDPDHIAEEVKKPGDGLTKKELDRLWSSESPDQLRRMMDIRMAAAILIPLLLILLYVLHALGVI